MNIFGDSYADNSTTSLREMIGIACGMLFVGSLFLIGAGTYLVACAFMAHFLFDDVSAASLIFFGFGVPGLVLLRCPTCSACLSITVGATGHD